MADTVEWMPAKIGYITNNRGELRLVVETGELAKGTGRMILYPTHHRYHVSAKGAVTDGR